MDEPLKDWRQLDAGRELDRLIAERVGYRVQWHKARLAEGYALFAPDGEPVENDDGFVNVYHLPGQPYGEVLEYSTSVDAAIRLVEPIPEFFLHRVDDPEGLIWWAGFDVPNGNSVLSDDPALAICRAFLAWQDALATRRDL